MQDKLYSLDLNRIRAGEDKRTTLMVKNIPNKYTQKMLLAVSPCRTACAAACFRCHSLLPTTAAAPALSLVLPGLPASAAASKPTPPPPARPHPPAPSPAAAGGGALPRPLRLLLPAH